MLLLLLLLLLLFWKAIKLIRCATVADAAAAAGCRPASVALPAPAAE
jgi:hypothetical protein